MGTTVAKAINEDDDEKALQRNSVSGRTNRLKGQINMFTCYELNSSIVKKSYKVRQRSSQLSKFKGHKAKVFLKWN